MEMRNLFPCCLTMLWLEEVKFGLLGVVLYRVTISDSLAVLSECFTDTKVIYLGECYQRLRTGIDTP